MTETFTDRKKQKSVVLVEYPKKVVGQLDLQQRIIRAKLQIKQIKN